MSIYSRNPLTIFTVFLPKDVFLFELDISFWHSEISVYIRYAFQRQVSVQKSEKIASITRAITLFFVWLSHFLMLSRGQRRREIRQNGESPDSANEHGLNREILWPQEDFLLEDTVVGLISVLWVPGWSWILFSSYYREKFRKIQSLRS